MEDRREGVIANARYLRNVRPIDPEEIHEYVEGQPHPAVVRQLLREEAPTLGLIEREDGTFVPVPAEPVAPLAEPVEAFPERYERRLEEHLVDRYGPDWHEGASGDLLRSTLRRVKASYLHGDPVDYDEDVAAGYAIYHLPGYYAAVQYALDDLAERKLLGRELRVLDVGAGVGGPALGLCDYLPEDALLEYHAVEPSDAADILEAMLSETRRNVHATVHRTTAEAFDPQSAGGGEPYDLVMFCNVLSELEEPISVCRRYLEALADDGSLLAMAPADRETSIGLRRVERALEAGARTANLGEKTESASLEGKAQPASSEGEAQPASDEGAVGRESEESETDEGGGETDDPLDVTVYGPAVRLWPGRTPSDRGWTFDVRPDLAVPSFQRSLDRAASDPDHEPGEFVNVDVQFSHSILRTDGTRRVDLSLDPGRWAKMAEMDRHVTNRIDLVAAKLSRSLSDDGSVGPSGSSPNPLFKVSDGSETVDHYAVVTAETAMNRSLLAADYGDVLAFESVLALWNEDERAYNLVVDEETIVDPVA
ncbi:small ribosomal subunit Rsm22 family protein [Halovivax sp.]|uniref:small ribosomal subunit Rsm22 family protein n=1 Tax=Halovivax sp. TaxID=1935978 RepID=UPI0025BA4EC0|nr:class I SAM-dependent methyltransferase [Halovivax sp.]